MIYMLSVLTSNTTWKGSKLSFEVKQKVDSFILGRPELALLIKIIVFPLSERN